MITHAYNPSVWEASMRLYFKKTNSRAGEMAQWLRAFAVLAEDLTWCSRCPPRTSEDTRHTCGVQTHI